MGPAQGYKVRGDGGRKWGCRQTQQSCLGGGDSGGPKASSYRGGNPPLTVGQWLLLPAASQWGSSCPSKHQVE